MKKYFNKEIVMTEDDNKNFESSTNCWICDKIFVGADVKVSNLVTGKYRDAAHRDCHVNVSLDYKIYIAFHSLKDYDANLIMQERGEFDFKINVIP